MLNNFSKTKLISLANSDSLVGINMVVDDEMALSEHIEEFSQRLVFCLLFLLFATLFCFADVKEIVQIFQAPAVGVKFLQFAPGEYFFASVKIAFFCGILISSPLILYQLLLYLIPGLTKNLRLRYFQKLDMPSILRRLVLVFLLHHELCEL